MKIPTLTMKHIAIIYSLTFLLFACNQQQNTDIVHKEDIKAYLNNSSHQKEQKLQEQIAFWNNKLTIQPTSHVYKMQLAGLYVQLFKETGDITLIHQTDTLLFEALKVTDSTNVGVWHMLSSNAITQHKFKKAKYYADKALEIPNNRYASTLLLFDAEMELGNYLEAELLLKNVDRENSFDYLIRHTKVLDHKGDLDAAIIEMEKAYKLLSPRKKGLKTWALSNLGDMYGHAGRIKDSYNTYLKVLELDPSYDYALKGIAWISYSKDKNTALAREIIVELNSRTLMPDYNLLLAEISEYEQKNTEKAQYLNLYKSEIEKEVYGGMYNKYLFNLMVDEDKDCAKAMAIAKEEVNNRATPMSYAQLAKSYLCNGNIEKANEIADKYVDGKSFEPEILMHLVAIYQQTKPEKAKKYLQECRWAQHELGPVVATKIEREIAQL